MNNVLALSRLGRFGLPQRALLAQASPPSSRTADRWLIRLRWVAIGGMLATILIGKQLVPAVALAPVLGALGAIVVLQVAWIAVCAWRGAERPSLVRLQIAFDVVALAGVLWFSGGISNPFAAFLTFQIVLAGLLCGVRMSIFVAVLATGAIFVLTLAAPLPFASAPLGEAAVRRIGTIVSLVSLAAFICFFVVVYVQRVAELRAESARNEKLAMLGRLVGAMSHELNTPLATIVLASKDLVEVGRELGSEEATTLARTIAEEAERASQIIGLVRGHVRPDQPTEPVELVALVRKAVTRELTRLGFAGDHVIDAPTPLLATVPRAGFNQVLVNLLTNAVQATTGVDKPRIEVRVRRRGARVETLVVDNGTGIDPSLLPVLGEPFQTTKAASGGMGLGLYVSSILAERMEGTLALEPHSGGGTRATFSVPLVKS